MEIYGRRKVELCPCEARIYQKPTLQKNPRAPVLHKAFELKALFTQLRKSKGKHNTFGATFLTRCRLNINYILVGIALFIITPGVRFEINS